MKNFQIRIDDQVFHVEIDDISVRPVRVQIDGEWFDVWPEETLSNHSIKETPLAQNPLPFTEPTPLEHVSVPSQKSSAETGTPSGSGRLVKSPLPGVIVAVHVQPGDEVMPGQPLCVVEAMKMNNVVRASQTGKVAALRVAVGQHVKHHDVLVEFV